MSDGEDSMEFPYVETMEQYHSLESLEIVKKKKKHELKVRVGTLQPEAFKTINRLRGQRI